MALLEVIKISKKYKNKSVLKELSFQIEEGELFGIAGGREAGKSSLANALSGHIKVTSGTFRFMNKDIGKNEFEYKKKWGIALQGMVFYPKLSAGHALELSMRWHGEMEWSWIEEILQFFELDYDLRVGMMTPGEHQRLVLSCAFVHRPSFYLLDEPTQNLDLYFRKKTFQLLQERIEKGASSLVLSDQWPLIEQYCHKAALLNKGEITTIEDLKTKTFISKRVTMRNITVLEKDLVHPKVQGVEIEYGDVSFVYLGDFREMTQFINMFKATDVVIQEVSLDDRWAYLEKEEK